MVTFAVVVWILGLGAAFGLAQRGDRIYSRVASVAATGAGYVWGSTAKRGPSTPAKKGQTRTGSTARTSKGQPTSIREAFRAGVQHAHEQQAAGKDIVTRTRRVAGGIANSAGRVYAGGQNITSHIEKVREKRAERQSNLAAAKNRHAVQDPPPPVSDKPTPDRTDAEKLHDLIHPDTDASRRFYALRDSGYKGPIDQNGRAVADDRLPLGTTKEETDMTTPVIDRHPWGLDGYLLDSSGRRLRGGVAMDDTEDNEKAIRKHLALQAEEIADGGLAVPYTTPADWHNTKEKDMPAITDLINVAMGIKEGQDGQRAAAQLMELWSELKMRAGSASERYSGVAWGTPRIDAAAAALAEATTIEAVNAAYAEWTAACIEAQQAAEPLAAVGGRGDVRDFQDA